MDSSRFVTPTASIPMDPLPALVIEEVLSSGIHAMAEALIRVTDGATVVDIYVTGTTPWSFIHALDYDGIADIQATDAFRRAVEATRDRFE